MDPNIAAGQQPEAPLEPRSREELAERLETVLWSPTATDEQVAALCRDSAALGIAAVFVRPDDLDLAISQLRGTSTGAGSVAGYPYGWSTTPVKLYEVRDMLRRGAREIAAVAPLGKLISRQFQAVESEVLQMSRSCHEEGARLRLVLDADSLAEDLKLIGMKIAKRCEVDFVQLAIEPGESVWEQAPFYKRVLKWFCGLAAPAPGGSLESVLRLYAADIQRISCSDPKAVLAAWDAVLEARLRQSQSEASPDLRGEMVDSDKLQ
jgi:deoxyribose-phosphate aldolase